MEYAYFNDHPVSKTEFKQEFLSLMNRSPSEAADVAFGLLKKNNRLQKDLEEATANWLASEEQVREQNKVLKSKRKESAKEKQANEEQINELMKQVDNLSKGQDLRQAKIEELRAEREKTKSLNKELKSKEKEMAALKRTAVRAEKKAEKVPQLLENIKKLNIRKKKLIEERKFEENRKKIYLEENRILKTQARENNFRLYDCRFHPETDPKTSDTNYLNFKNDFYK